jgi:hypothetical protein
VSLLGLSIRDVDHGRSTFAGTRTPLMSWFAAGWYVVNQKQGVFARGCRACWGWAAIAPRGRGCTSFAGPSGPRRCSMARSRCMNACAYTRDPHR